MITSSSLKKKIDVTITERASKFKQRLTNSYPLALAGADKIQVEEYFKASQRLYEWLFSGIHKTAESIQPHPFRKTLAFYYGHTTAFYANHLKKQDYWKKLIAQWDESMTTGVWPTAASDIASHD